VIPVALGAWRELITDCRCKRIWIDDGRYAVHYRTACRFRLRRWPNYIRTGTSFASGKPTGRVPFDIYAIG
jgi:hypothetical protein